MRRNKFLLITVISSIFMLNAQSVSAQTSFNTFWKKFRAAVTKKDKTTVAALTKFPVSMPYGVKSVRTRAQFLRRYNEIFFGEANAAKCFKTATADKISAKRYEVACGFRNDTTESSGTPLVYTFELTKSGWRFVSFDNINE